MKNLLMVTVMLMFAGLSFAQEIPQAPSKAIMSESPTKKTSKKVSKKAHKKIAKAGAKK